ncbi:MAG: Ig-like domain-containing protein, partial [Blastocatellia bacterium]
MQLKRFLLISISLVVCAVIGWTLAIRSGVSRAQTGSNGEKMQNGLQFRLSEGSGSNAGESQPPAAQASPLSSGETASLLERLSPLKSETADQKEFALRPGSLPAPKTGKVINASFPPSENEGPPEKSATGPLEVVRYSPDGDVPIAPELSVTFSQPMVAVTSQEEAATSVPVELSPKPKGKWHWIGTKTLLFEPDQRFPMATRYKVEVPAGTKSALGNPLDKTVTWTFSTPPPQVKQTYPGRGPQTRDPLMFVSFDQRIDPSAVLATTKITAEGANYSVRQASAEEV